MKHVPPSLLALLNILCHIHWSLAATFLCLFPDDACQDSNPRSLIGLDDGYCTPILDAFSSFKLTEVDVGYGVTVYGSGNLNCGLSDKWALGYNQCYSNTSINQFTVDGGPTNEDSASSSVVTSSQVSSTAYVPASSTSRTSTTLSSITSVSSTASSGSTSSSADSGAGTSPPSPTSKGGDGSGLNTDNKIGLGVGIPSAIAAVGTMIVWLYRVHNRKKKQGDP